MRFASIAVTALLARLLSKDDFGTFAVALAVYLVVSSLAELGLGSAIARSADEPEDIAPTVVTMSVLISVGLAAAMWLGADTLAAVLGQPPAAEPIRVLAVCLALTGVFAVPGAQLVREFRQDRIFYASVAGFLVANPILVLMALNGGGATSFAWSRVIGQLASGLVMVGSTSRRYWPGWRQRAVRGLLAFGVPLALANLVNWTLLNADYMIIGRLVTAAEVGVYMIAFNAANWSTAMLGSVLNTVVVPAFGRVSSHKPRLADALASATRLVGLIVLPVGTLTLALADPLVVTLFGARWSDAAPVLSVLAVYGVLYSFSLLYANVLVATGATVQLLLVQVAWIVMLVPGVVVGVRLGGLTGVAWAHVITISLVAVPCYLWVALSATAQRARVLGGVLAWPAFGAALAGLAAALTRTLLDTAILQVVLGALVGGLTYLLATAPLIVGMLPERLWLRVGGTRLGARVSWLRGAMTASAPRER